MLSKFPKDFITPLAIPLNDPRAHRGGGRGPELCPSTTDGGWTLGGSGIAQGAGGITFANSTSTTNAQRAPLQPIKNGAYYRIEVTVVDWIEGSLRVQLYGTGSFLGQTGVSEIAANGTHTKFVTVVPGGSLTQVIRLQSNGATTPGNTFRVSALSIKEVLN